MKLLRDVVIKQVLTKKRKAKMIQELQGKLQQVNREIEQLKFHLHKATKESGNKHDQQEIRARYMKDIKNREAKASSILFKVKQMETLTEGIELSEGTVSSIIEVRKGDPWPEMHQPAEIVVKDGIIEEIRESRNVDE
ncbi:hypothetical protein JCM9140_137 [Halalkalibacter wakoensis JCM 9140]|uniref:YlqD protein n=1 Tax=Halalkalibacter wakoensis JCM 9140 TaxID=1236970 RepID=W4PX05_9BACI|nr:YlqD family protein [Halalkalibacter wakoensis]GAE24225.1 hypothetical protein JCM9140_137 [Halalkalibacter wakoensis JCM 9140]